MDATRNALGKEEGKNGSQDNETNRNGRETNEDKVEGRVEVEADAKVKWRKEEVEGESVVVRVCLLSVPPYTTQRLDDGV